MAAAGPWSVKGIDPKAREIAKDLARRSGLTLGDWLNQMIIDGGEPEAAAPPPQPRRPLDELYREAQAARRSAGSAPGTAEGETSRMARALESLATRVEAGEHRATLAISGIDQSMMGVLSRLDELDREHVATGARLSGLLGDVRGAQAAIAERLRRGEGDGPSGAALETLKTGLDRLAERLDAAAARAAAEQALTQEAAEEMARRMERVETVMEAAPAAFADAEKVETVLTRMAERLDHTETKTDAALQTLQASFANLDARLRSGEARMAHVGGQEMERRFQSLAQELTQRVEASRAELAQRLRGAADGGRMDKLETALREIGGQVDLAEKRSAQAIDRIGREVMRVAHNLGDRMGAVERTGAELVERTDARMAEIETRSAAAAEAVAGEMTRAAEAMEARLRDADSAQALALEKLGGEIERIAERLAERIATADRRQAEAIDEVTDRVAKIGARIDERHDQTSGELSERIRISEARTAQLLEDARSRLEGHRSPAQSPAHPPPLEPFVIEAAPPPEVAILPASHDREPAHAEAEFAHPQPALSNADPFTFEDSEPSDFVEATATPHPYGEPSPIRDEAATTPVDDERQAPGRHDPFSAESPFDPDDDFAPAAPWRGPEAGEAAHEPAFPEPAAAHPAFEPAESLFEPAQAAPEEPEPFEPAFSGFSVSDFAPAAAVEPEPPAEQLSTRQMLDAARQAARRAAGGKGEASDGSIAALPRESKGPGLRAFNIGFPGRRKKETAPTLRTFVLASGIAGSLTAMGVGAYMIGGASHEGAPPTSTELAANGPAPSAAGSPAALAPSAAPTAAVALAPSMTPPAPVAQADDDTATPSAKAAPSHPSRTASERAHETPAPVKPEAAPRSPSALYASAVSRLNAGDVGALHDLLAAADAGSAPAQFYLARLYDAGGAGLPKDTAQARRWTERAAKGGEPSAMYNLASYLYAGDGGPKDVPQAADWFRRSAERGVVNGQYNLAQLYEKGYGVAQSDQDAYKWYLVAAGSGDAEAKQAAAAVKRKLPIEAQANAERAAVQTRAGLGDALKTAAATPAAP